MQLLSFFFLFISLDLVFCSFDNKNNRIIFTNNSFGLGNSLYFLPSAYFYSVFTNRTLYLDKKSSIAEVCAYIHCNIQIYPHSISNRFPHVEEIDLYRFAYSNKEIHKEEFVILLNPKQPWVAYTDWWTLSAGLSKKVSELSGCPMYDFACSEQFVLRQIFVGPIRLINPSVLNIPESYLTTLAHQSRGSEALFDLGIHIRNKFESFEASRSDKLNSLEGKAWVSSSIGLNVLKSLKNKIRSMITAQKTVLSHTPPSLKIFLAGDSSYVKDHFMKAFQEEFRGSIEIFSTHQHIIHSLHLPSVSHSTSSSSTSEEMTSEYMNLFVLAFDFYALSMSRSLVAFRGKYFSDSTYLRSAAALSSSYETLCSSSPLKIVNNPHLIPPNQSSTHSLCSAQSKEHIFGSYILRSHSKPTWLNHLLESIFPNTLQIDYQRVDGVSFNEVSLSNPIMHKVLVGG